MIRPQLDVDHGRQRVAVRRALREDGFELPPRFVMAALPGQDGAKQHACVAVSGRPGQVLLQQLDGLYAVARDGERSRARDDIVLPGVELGGGAHHHHQHRTDSRP